MDDVTFADLGLRETLLTELTSLGYEEPTPVQAEAIPPLVAGDDLLGQAATGTGKTAAFALPLLQRLAPGRQAVAPMALVLVPTRELAVQVSEAVHRYGKGLGVRVLPVYGGQPIVRQLKALRRGVDVVVATPGRAVDHLDRGTLDLSAIEAVVLDEADEMLDMGFADDLDRLLTATPEGRQTVLFSATMPPRIETIARTHLREPVRVELGRGGPATGEVPLVKQIAYVVPRSHKPQALGRVLDVEAPEAAIVFCRTREECEDVAERLNGHGHRAEALHGGLTQAQRDKVMERLRGGTADLLVATDVAARGLDVDTLTHVINYDVPASPEAYVHRIGRVGRAGREGTAVTLAQPREHRMIKAIERLTGRPVAIEPVPSVADLRAKRMEALREALRDRVGEDAERYRVVLEDLAEEVGVTEVALAALALADAATATGSPEAEQEIPQVAPPAARPGRAWEDRPGRGAGTERPPRGQRPDRRAGGGGAGDGAARRHPKAPDGPLTRIFFGSGSEHGVQPKDLVGAICGESSLSGGDIGAIRVQERFSLVEVPADRADHVVESLRGATIKGKRTTVRRERY